MTQEEQTAYEAMQQERDEAWGELGFTKNDLGNALYRAEAAEATVARLWEIATKWREEYEVAIAYDRRHGLRDRTVELGGMAMAADAIAAVLSASSTPDTTKTKTTTMRAADLSAPSDRQDLREVPDTKGSQRIAICERCQMRLPERLVTFGIGVRGGAAARCAACAPQLGPDGEANRAEVIAIRKSMR